MARIGILHYSVPPVLGGVELLIAEHVRLFVKRGHFVRVIAGEGGPLEGAETVIVPEARSNPEGDFEELKNALLEKLPLDDLDVLFAHNVLTMPFNLPLAAALAEVARRRPGFVVAWCHDAAYLDPTYKLPPPEKYPWSLIAHAQPGVRYVAISRYRQRVIGELLDADMGYVPDGVDPWEGLEAHWREFCESKELSRKAPVLLAPVRLTPRKNLELAVEIVAEMRRLGREAVLLITGPGDPHNPQFKEYGNRLLKLARERGAELHILTWELGPIDDPKPWLGVADALVLTSRMEGFGLPAVEAALARLPALLSDIPPLKEVAGPNALFFSIDEEPRSIAERALQFLEDNPAYRARRRALEEYSWDAVYEKYIRPLIASH